MGVQHRSVEHITHVPVPQTHEEIVHVPEVVTQEQVVHNPVEHVVNVPRPQIHEKVIEVPKMHVTEKLVKVPKITHHVTDTVVHNNVQTIEVEKPQIVHKTVSRKKQIINE